MMLQHLRFLCHDGQMMAEERMLFVEFHTRNYARAVLSIYQAQHERSHIVLLCCHLHAVGYQQPISIEALQQSDSSYNIFMDNLVMDQLVTSCAAIVSLDSSLVNVGDYIEMSSVCTHENVEPFHGFVVSDYIALFCVNRAHLGVPGRIGEKEKAMEIDRLHEDEVLSLSWIRLTRG
ncbi:hypothetical protein EMCRGX_G023058 [Ephydatia muelleri]